MYCNEETGLFLAALALQAEFGDYMPEVLDARRTLLLSHLGSVVISVHCFAQLYGKTYYQPEHYVSKRMLEKLALPNVKDELPRLHAKHAPMGPEEAETEYLKVCLSLHNGLALLLLSANQP